MRIQHNIAAQNSYRQLGGNNNALGKNLEKLSSGYKINRAGDDAAGLAISEKMRAQITGLKKAQDNANDGISLVQTAEGALTEVHSMLNRMTELATQSANGTYDDSTDRANLQKEVSSLQSEVDRISKSTNFNGIDLLNGSLGASKVNTEVVTGTAGTTEINSGMTVGKLVDGTGSKGEYTIDMKGALGRGDEMTIDYVDKTGADQKLTIKRYDAVGDEIAITGNTAEEQAESLKAQLTSKLGNDFNISVKGSKITLQSNKEGLSADGTATTTDIAGITKVDVKNTSITSNSTVKITTAFADTDTLKFDYTKADGSAGSITLAGKTTAINANDFTVGTPGATQTADQAKSIAEILNGDKDFSEAFSVKVDGDKLVFEAKTDKAVLGTATKTGTGAISQTSSSKDTASTTAAATKMENSGITGLVSNSSEYKVGDVLSFKFNVEGVDLEARVELTDDMFTAGKLNTSAGTEQIANALKNAKFADAAGTLTDESQYKVSDFFEIGANEKPADGTAEDGSINIGGKSGGLMSFTGVKLTAGDGRTLVDDTPGTAVTTPGTAGTTTKGAAATNYSSTTELSGPNFSDGDKFELTGTLHDGQEFKVSLQAGKDFEIGATQEDTLDNINNALKNGVYNKTGGGSVSINAMVGDKQISSANLFGAGGEFTIDTAGANDFKVTSNINGTVYDKTKTAGENAFASGGNIKVNVTPNSEAAAESKLLNGTTPTSGHTSISFEDGKLGYGSAIKIGGKTFEIVKSEMDKTNAENIAIVIDDIKNAKGDDVARAIEDKINNDQTTGLKDKMNAIAVNGKLTVSTKETGSNILAPEISLVNGTKINNVSVKFEPKDMEVGKQFEVNGQKFQVYQTGKPPVEAEAGTNYVAIDLEKATSADIANAVANKINSDENLSKKINVNVEDDGTITFASRETETDESGATKFKDATFKMENKTQSEGKGLVLQIGDTAEDFNKVSVSIEDMSSKSLGIADVNISTQEGANAAIDKIKSAINSVSSTRGDLGAVQNRLEHTINNLGVTEENMTSAESRIRDTDMAKEMMAYTKNNILIQASQAMLAQANQLPQGVLQLLG